MQEQLENGTSVSEGTESIFDEVDFRLGVVESWPAGLKPGNSGDFSGKEGFDDEADHAGQDNGGQDSNTDEPVLNAR